MKAQHLAQRIPLIRVIDVWRSMQERLSSVLDGCEATIEEVIWEGERQGKHEQALAILEDVIERLVGLDIAAGAEELGRRQGLHGSHAQGQHLSPGARPRCSCRS